MRYRYFVDFRHGSSVFANFSYGITILRYWVPPPPPPPPMSPHQNTRNTVISQLKCFFISTAYSLNCYECKPDISEDDCDNNKVQINCTFAEPACSKIDYKTKSGESYRARRCLHKTTCEENIKKCEDGTFPDDSYDTLKSCSAYCCSDKDLCNGAFTVTANVFVLSTIMLFSLNMF